MILLWFHQCVFHSHFFATLPKATGYHVYSVQSLWPPDCFIACEFKPVAKCILGQRDKGHWASRLVLRREVKQGIVQAVCTCNNARVMRGRARTWWGEERWVNDEGDKGQSAISFKEGSIGIWGGWNVCVLTSDFGVFGHLDCPLFLPRHALSYSFVISSLLSPYSAQPTTCFPNLLPILLSMSISGTSMVQSLPVGLLARFPSGSSINSSLLTLSKT